MWIQQDRDKIELARRKKYKSIKKPLMYSSLNFILFSTWMKLGISKGSPPSFNPISWEQFFHDEFTRVLLSSILIFLVLYAWQIIFKKEIGADNNFICKECGQVKRWDGDFNCECGGTFVRADEMKWIDKEDEQKELSE